MTTRYRDAIRDYALATERYAPILRLRAPRPDQPLYTGRLSGQPEDKHHPSMCPRAGQVPDRASRPVEELRVREPFRPRGEY